MRHEVDILVVGTGLVGCALAAALAETNYLVGIVGQALPTVAPTQEMDSRIYAINPRSRRFLTQCGVWNKLSAQRITAIRQMRIAEQGRGEAALHFDAVEAGVDELAATVESQCLHVALASQLLGASNIRCFTPSALQQMTVHPSYVKVVLDDQQCIDAKLVIGADGAHSSVRQHIDSKVIDYGYAQQGVVANFLCEKSHQYVAYQWFFPDGILAWLPLPDKQISMVWSANQPLATQLLALSAQQLADKVAMMGGQVLGQLTLLNKPVAFPLHLTHVSHWVSPRVALVGDAAHTVHPLAGQGVNLGFADGEVLARLLLKYGKDPGQLRVLRQYERERREAVYMMQGVTHALKLLFNNRHPVLTPLRRFGLRCTDRSGFIKRQLIQAAR